MKKKILLGTVAVIVTAGGAFGVSALSDQTLDKSYGKDGIETEVDTHMEIDTNKLVGAHELEDIVLSKVQGNIEEIELEDENGKLLFKVEIESKENRDAEVYVDAYTGEVIEVEYDDRDDEQETEKEDVNESDQNENEKNSANHKQVKSSEQTSTNEIISREKAIDIAKEVHNGTVQEAELDEDDGQQIFEIEFEDDEEEVEVEIDAKTGKVLNVEYDD
ncbi:PepSY domain-containing protein [Allobacillus sp. GCM10007491]|uniref:PepSY domain-containing protein n=1 Tax=Allobacillus saliphilus TaxID=2912308 RepID=A0A941HT68_9BACI|nr:PepSY domain-containing protein [Allobacillus saliphilus]